MLLDPENGTSARIIERSTRSAGGTMEAMAGYIWQTACVCEALDVGNANAGKSTSATRSENRNGLTRPVSFSLDGR